MKRMLLAGVIAASAAIMMPAYAQVPAANPNPPPAPAPANPPEQPAGGPAMPSGGPAMRGVGPGMRGGPMMRREMWRRAEMRWNPAQRCIDRLARRAAHRAYVETELNLTPAQRPLWDKLQSIAQGEQQKERQFCSQLKPGEELTTLQRLDRAQQFLTARLDALNAAKPAVQALYQSLNPEQKAIFDHPFRRD